MNNKTKWSKEPDNKDYINAGNYLLLICDEKEAAKLVKKLKCASANEFQAKDILRASGLPLLMPTDSKVKDNHEKILAGKKISPLLLVRHACSGRVIIADGYHRMCAVYSIDEDSSIPCKIV
ncbi:MAG: hypothetical protein JO354_10560 [Verrucomicrobia bacterium]|nr:hypothetical protein [Verrucomicrobiota bacterium]